MALMRIYVAVVCGQALDEQVLEMETKKGARELPFLFHA
jgi:hypothetical protein